MTLVELTVTNDADGPREVRIRSAVPVLPPRTRGVPAAVWTGTDDDRVAVLEVGAGEQRGLGYASPETAEPPAELVAAEAPAEPEAPEPVADLPPVEPTAEGVARDLPSAGPPRDALPPATGTDDGGGTPAADGGTGEAVDRPAAIPEPSDTSGGDAVPDHGPDGENDADAGARSAEWSWGPGTDRDTEALPPEVADWLDGVAERIGQAESLAAADTVPAATERVAAAGGPAAVERLTERVAGDPERLRRLAGRAERLAKRAESVDVPVPDLRRLA